MPALEHVSNLELDRYFAGNIGEAEQRALESHIEHCTRCTLRRDVLLADRERFLERVPTWDALLTRRRPAGARHLAAISCLLLAAAAALLVLTPRAAPPSVRSKGGPQLGTYIKRGERVLRAQSGDKVRPGDGLRLTYTSAKPSQFAVLHRDSRAASVYYPLSGHTVAIEAGRDVALDFGIRLDSAPGEEQLFGLFCEDVQALEPLRAALQSDSQLPKLPHCQVDLLTLTKEPE